MDNIQTVLEEITPIISKLYRDETKLFLEELQKRFGTIEKITKQFHEMIFRECGRPVGLYKNGFTKKGKQKYITPNRKYSMSDTTNNVLFGTKLSYEVWEKYIFCIIIGLSLQASAEYCKISKTTSFSLRHKICKLMENYKDNETLSGTIQMDEVYFTLNMKGPWNGKLMPRAPKESGDHSRAGLGKDKICVLTAIDGAFNTFNTIIGSGAPTIDQIENGINKKIIEKSTIVTDGKKTYVKVAKNLNCNLEMIKFPLHVKGDYTINGINSYHALMKSWFRRFKGVSTKHLKHYLCWFRMIVYYYSLNYSNQEKRKKELLLYFLREKGYLKVSDLHLDIWPVNIWDCY